MLFISSFANAQPYEDSSYIINYQKLSDSFKDNNSESYDFVINLQKNMDNIIETSDSYKLKFVNDYVNNNILYATDILNWNSMDYWATPKETISKMAGDCEDFVFLKYFLLLSLNVDSNKLKISYVKLNNDEFHMVLSYYENIESTPLILDNYERRVLPANERKDLSLIFQFNLKTIWIANISSDNNHMSKLNFLIDRINQEKFFVN